MKSDQQSYFFISLIIALLVVCFPSRTFGETIRTVEIIHTTDLHASLSLPDETSSGNMPRVASAIKKERSRFGTDKCLHIDTGDLLQGSTLGSLTRGKAAVEALRVMGCEAWIPGNHDFDFGVEAFEDAVQRLSDIAICGNLQPLKGSLEFMPWRIYHRNGVKIIVIGATASYLANWFLDDINNAYHAISAIAMLHKCLDNVLAETPDMIILAIHQGWMGAQQDHRKVNEVADIAKLFPQIDIILGGHTHRLFSGRRIGPRSWYIQPGASGEQIGLAEVECDIDSHEVKCIRSRFLIPTKDTPDDTDTVNAIRDICKKYDIASANTLIAPPIGRDISANGRPGENCAMSELICQAMLHATKSDLALHGILSRESIKANEPITLAKLYKIIPYENTIVTCMVTKEEMENILTEQFTLRKSYTYAGLYGATVTFNADGSAHITSSWTPGTRKKLSLNSFAAAGSGRTPVMRKIILQQDCALKNTKISTREALGRFLKLLTTVDSTDFSKGKVP